MYDESHIKAFLRSIIYKKAEVDDWFAGKEFPFFKHHPEFGWLLSNAQFRNGINKSLSNDNELLNGLGVLKGNFKAIPYYAWSYRGVGEMAVWFSLAEEHL